MLKMLIPLVAALFACAPGVAKADQSRHALIIANSKYAKHPLKNPKADAMLVASRLRTVGFSVVVKLDLTKTQMERSIQDFHKALAASQNNSLSLIYFAGHGVTLDGLNYLIPVDAKLKSLKGVREEAVLADRLFNSTQTPSILVLDACRDNPFKPFERTNSLGLSRMEVPEGSAVAYSTRPGSVASDGAGMYSPFAEAFAETITVSGLTLSDIWRVLAEVVHHETKGSQIPVTISSLKDDVLLTGTDRVKTLRILGHTLDIEKLESKPNPMGVCFVNTGVPVNVRIGPSIQHPILYQLPSNACGIASAITCSGEVPAKFCQLEVVNTGILGWVSFNVYRYDPKRKIITRE